MKYLSILSILLSLCFSFSSCEADLEVTPDKDPGKLPKFNFLVRQIESDEKSGSTEVVDTSDTIRAELYIRQLDYTAEDEKYKLIVTLPENFEGLMHYKGATYRSGDWIEVLYKDLTDNVTLINFTQRKHLPGMYNLNLICSDKDENSKSATLALIVP